MKSTIGFVLGALAASSLAATAFRGGGQPVDSTFTYQGQLRNAGQLVNGSVDVRFTLWDSAAGGTQIGNVNAYTNYPLTDGRFALGLNFGPGAFNGDQRWVQVEFRSPAGVGQYLTLNPRDKIVATPYALYALNGVESQWDYNPKSQALTTGENVAKVGIGTSSPTALLEVVGVGGDDAVKLPAGSVGADELGTDARARSIGLTGYAQIGNTQGGPHDGGWLIPITKEFELQAAGMLTVSGTWVGILDAPIQLIVDGDVVQNGLSIRADGQYPYGMSFFSITVPLSAGNHSIMMRYGAFLPPCPPGVNCYWISASATLTVLVTPDTL
jgi:hypothetical protein